MHFNLITVRLLELRRLLEESAYKRTAFILMSMSLMRCLLEGGAYLRTGSY